MPSHTVLTVTQTHEYILSQEYLAADIVLSDSHTPWWNIAFYWAHFTVACANMTQVEEFLTELYHGKPKACDLAKFTGKMKTKFGPGGEEQECRVTLDGIRSMMTELKEEVRQLLAGW